MNLENPQNVKCLRCKCYRSEADFYNDKGRRLKSCQNCRDIGAKSREKCKCEHGRQRSRCKECLGYPSNRGKCSRCRKPFEPLDDGKQTCLDCRYTCPHKKNNKKECDICSDERRINYNKKRQEYRHETNYKSERCSHHLTSKWKCKICSDPIKLTIKNMLQGAKYWDKKHNRYDVVNFVDYCFVENLLDDYKCCYYEDCKKELQIMEYNNSMASLERINNNIGHIKSNCVICCLECNKKVKSNETTC